MQAKLLKYQIIPLLFFFSLTANSNFSSNKRPQKIKKKLTEIKEALKSYEEQKKSSLQRNPLANEKIFSKFQSKSYLHLYQAIGFYLVSENKIRKKQQLKWLHKSLISLKKSLQEPFAPKKEVTEWQTKVHLKILEKESLLRKANKIKQLALKVLKEDPENKKALLFLLASLYQTQNTTERRKILQNPLLQDELEAEILKPFKETIKNDQDYLAKEEAQERALLRKIYKEKESILGNIKTILLSKEKDYYKEEHKTQLEAVAALYRETKNKKKKTKKEQIFIQLVEKNLAIFDLNYSIETAESLWKNKLWFDSQQLFKKLEKDFSQEKDKANILYQKAKLYERNNLYKSAKETYQQVSLLNKNNPYHEISLYKVAQLAYLRSEKNYGLLFEKYLKKYPHHRFESSARYFSLKERKKHKRKDYLLKVENLFKDHLLSYYSILLSKEHPDLYKKIFFQQIGQEKQNLPPRKAPSEFLELFSKCIKELKYFSLSNHARDLLLDINLKMKDIESRLYLVDLNKEVNNTSGVIINSIRIFYDFPDKRSLIKIQNIFPLEELRTIEASLKNGQIKNISPTLVLSLIRQESAFDSDAHSQANAMGLMQLIPSTAKEVAQKIKQKEYSLFEPKDNIALGTYYLHELLQKFSGNPIYALSAYNAGPSKAKRWAQARGKLNDEKFVETIPYLETSNYVKLIARNYVFYQLLYTQEKDKKIKFLF